MRKRATLTATPLGGNLTPIISLESASRHHRAPEKVTVQCACPGCKTEFVPKKGHAGRPQRYCSQRCYDKDRGDIRRRATRQLRDPRVHPANPDDVRYHVNAITGLRIDPARLSYRSTSQRSIGTCYSVVDDDYGRVVAVFEPESIGNRKAKRRAVELCDQLNAEEEADLRDSIVA